MFAFQAQFLVASLLADADIWFCASQLHENNSFILTSKPLRTGDLIIYRFMGQWDIQQDYQQRFKINLYLYVKD